MTTGPSREARSEVVLRFQRGARGAKALQQAIDEILIELRADPVALEREARPSDVSVTDLAGVQIEVAESEAGVEPFSTFLLIKFVGGMSAAAGGKIFNMLIWPRIKRRLGSDALGDEQAEQ